MALPFSRKVVTVNVPSGGLWSTSLSGHDSVSQCIRRVERMALDKSIAHARAHPLATRQVSAEQALSLRNRLERS
jgi:hypothetical protein